MKKVLVILVFLSGLATSRCAQLSDVKPCPFGALGCDDKIPQKVNGCYQGLIVLDGQDNQVCNLEADMSRLNFYSIGNYFSNRFDSSNAIPHFGYEMVEHSHLVPKKRGEKSYYAVKSGFKAAAVSTLEID